MKTDEEVLADIRQAALAIRDASDEIPLVGSMTIAEISLVHLWCWLMNLLDLMECNSPSGKTFPASSQQKTTPSDVSWEQLSAQMTPCHVQQAKDGQVQVWLPGQGHGQHGGFSTLNISDWHNDASVSSLSSVLETSIPQRFYLSPKACAGILRRAEKRGKTLPQQLQRALAAAAGLEQILIATED
jgi:hypothetical protein